jgi:hypothetical protein
MRSGLKHLLIHRLTKLNQKCHMITRSFVFSPIMMLLSSTSVEIKRNDYVTTWFSDRSMYLTLSTPVLKVLFMRWTGVVKFGFYCGTEGGGWLSYKDIDHPNVYELLLAHEYKLVMDYCKKLRKFD